MPTRRTPRPAGPGFHRGQWNSPVLPSRRSAERGDERFQGGPEGKGWEVSTIVSSGGGGAAAGPPTPEPTARRTGCSTAAATRRTPTSTSARGRANRPTRTVNAERTGSRPVSASSPHGLSRLFSRSGPTTVMGRVPCVRMSRQGSANDACCGLSPVNSNSRWFDIPYTTRPMPVQ